MRGAYGISQYMEGTGANLRLPLNPPGFFESVGRLRFNQRPGHSDDWLCGVETSRSPSGQVRAWDPNLRPQFTQQWNIFVERLVTPSMSANVGYVGTMRRTW